MSLSGKITNIGCRIDLGAIEPVSKSDFQTIVPNGHTFYAAQRFNQLNFGHYKKWVIVDKYSCTLYSSFYVCYYQRRKKPVSHAIASDSEV